MSKRIEKIFTIYGNYFNNKLQIKKKTLRVELLRPSCTTYVMLGLSTRTFLRREGRFTRKPVSSMPAFFQISLFSLRMRFT